MSDTPFIKFFPSDFLAGVSGLSPSERGVYITVLSLIWDNDGPVDMDEGRLARRCGGPKATVKKIIQVLIDEGKLVRTARGLTNRRAENALSDRQSRVKKAKGAARQRWDAQSEKTQQNQRAENAGAYADAMPPDMLGGCHPESRVQSYDDGDDAGASLRDSIPPDDLPFPDDGNQSVPNDVGLRGRLLVVCGVDPESGLTGHGGQMLGTASDMLVVSRWKSDLQMTDDEIITVATEVMARKPDGPPNGFSYFSKAMARYAGQRDQQALSPITPQPGGTTNGKSTLSSDVRRIASAIHSGEANFATANRDPFAVQPGGDDGADRPTDPGGEFRSLPR